MPSPLEPLTRRRNAGAPATDVDPTPMARAEQLDWPVSPPASASCRCSAGHWTTSRAKVVVVAGPQLNTWVELFARAWPRSSRSSWTGRDPSETHMPLALEGPFDVVLQAADTTALTQARLVPALFFHLREGALPHAGAAAALDEDEVAAAQAEGRVARQEQRGRAPLPNEDGALVPPYVGELWDVVAEAQRSLLREEEGRPDRARARSTSRPRPPPARGARARGVPADRQRASHAREAP